MIRAKSTNIVGPRVSQTSGEKMTDVVVIGAGPAGVLAALRAADLGARATVVASREFGGMAANDGPVPVRTLAHAGRLMRDARQLGQYGVNVSEPVLDYPLLLARVREVAADVRSLSSLRQQIDSLRVTVHEQTGQRASWTHAPLRPRVASGFKQIRSSFAPGE
jgi:pyruvate/2-oxoglutarate dehydrogenase complex dihydrolipoamide dehydrogenase (E3) component